ncbi:MAG: HIT family protein [Verrucomicrobiota bacterium]
MIESDLFTVHPQLAGQSVFVCELQLSRLVLMNNQRFPWLLLIPRLNDVTEIVDLSEEHQMLLWREIARVSQLLRDLFQPDKLNVATIGNLVPQLHVHLIARFQTDEAWPKPTFGFAPPLPYSPEERDALLTRILAAIEESLN